MDLNHLCSTKREIFGSMICESEPVLCSAVVSEHYEKDVLCQRIQCRHTSDAALIASDLNTVKESNAMPL